jgi:L-ascorbate 6-phosphate lactonase
MTTLAEEIKTTNVKINTVHLWWLAQAGFVFKTSGGQVIYLDAYLSDVVERLHGFKRMSLAPIEAKDVKADLVISTHEHEDHFDLDAIPIIAKNNPDCKFAGSLSCQDRYELCDIKSNRYILLEIGKSYSFSDVTIYTCRADHGDFSPTAVAVLLDFDGIKVFYTSDTAWRPELFQTFCNLKPDVLLPCINGNFGNMNHIDAARLTQQVNPKIVIPCHFWMFIEHGGDPAGFMFACKNFCLDTKVIILKPGEGLLCQS